MKSYVQVRDVLESARRFHRDLEAFYEQQVEQHGQSDRVALLLERMAQHERFFQEELEQYTDGDAGQLLDRWIQYGPDEEQIEVPAAADIQPNLQVEDVEKMAVQFNKRLIDFYRTTAERIDQTSVCRLFQNLAQRMEKNQAERVYDASHVRVDL